MIDQWMLLWVIAAHFFADFACQGRFLATNKSSNFLCLVAHVAIYAAVMCVLLIPAGLSLTFVAMNAILHLTTDFVSSRLTSKFYKEGRFYAFWNTIAVDQFAHLAPLILLLS